ncbi:MAG: beta-N-acetylhexosaminidase [Oscillospiraceae bacterium]|nr:beta-N-acetylhexosaminidase [Oscillospiraceae bacterium]
MKSFDTFGVMLDCSRNAVMSPETLKKFIRILAKMGYNQLQLYMEDTYEVDGEPYFGYLRGRYTQSELKAIDDYAASYGVELVPCIQTLAHMNAAVRWPKYSELTDIHDILLVGDDRTYELIDHMFSSLRKCFRSDKIHIGMDEAERLGRGRYMDAHGDQNAGDILLSHLKRVCELADRYNFRPMMWSDMFYKIANGGSYYSHTTKFDPSVSEKIPSNLSLVYWDYYHRKKEAFVRMIKGHRQLTDRIVFAGGLWKWIGFAVDNDYSIRSTKAALSACIQENVRNVMLTMWGDDGAEASAFAMLPSLCSAACFAQGITNRKDIEAKFFEWTGLSFADFMLLDIPNKPKKVQSPVCPCKYLLYNDCFMSILETASRPNDSKKYASFARRLKNASARTGEFSYIFKSASALCRVLSLKANICTETRAIYSAHDTVSCRQLIRKYDRMIRYTEQFYRLFRAQWYSENKPHGFDVQDIRIGGLICRMKDCRERLSDWADGKLDRIPELEENLLPLCTDISCYNSWRNNVTANVL